jgi:hypothetical protein
VCDLVVLVIAAPGVCGALGVVVCACAACDACDSRHCVHSTGALDMSAEEEVRDAIEVDTEVTVCATNRDESSRWTFQIWRHSQEECDRGRGGERSMSIPACVRTDDIIMSMLRYFY